MNRATAKTQTKTQAKPKPSQIISRHTLMWLLIVNLSVLLPLYDKMTPWSMAICAICLVWRFGIFTGKVAKPPRYLVALLAVASAITLALVSSQMGILNGLINLLILGYALKYIEVSEHRDVRAVVMVGFFLIAITFIEKQSLWFTLQLLLVASINLSVLVSLYLGGDSWGRTARLGVKLILQSLPLAILLFIVLPRLPPLWLVPKATTAQTGLSDSVAFGDIGQLTRSPALAFRVSFQGVNPSNQQLYWRAIVLEDYDGSRWTQSQSTKLLHQQLKFQKGRNDFRQRPLGRKFQYDVISEPTHQRWLFGLDQAFGSHQDVINMPDGSLYSLSNLDQEYQYHVTTYPDAPLSLNLSRESRWRNLKLPKDSNPKTAQLAEQFTRDYPDPSARLSAMMRLFNQSPYYYTLRPPAVGPQQIDDFLFENKAGFCVHYASAFTFMARRSGIPARLVTGYQGGEWNQNAQYLSVYQYMAHAWVEVWLEDQGWVRFDPTAMIAPGRIEQGFDAVFTPEQSYLMNNPFNSLRLRQYPLLNQIRLSLASINFYWSKWVLGFDNDKQHELLERLLGQINMTKMVLFVGSIMALIALLIAFNVGLISFSRRQDSLVAAFEQIADLLAKRGLGRKINESPTDYGKRVLGQAPQLNIPLSAFIDSYMALKYRPLSPDERQRHLQRFKQQVKQLGSAIHRHPWTS
ncbi:DUF3488 and transglutaminase-like domain-containing protein [Shewanella sp. AS1]|uniref:transglutaminase TgpA family protein n=1 Tax=Shewanella sp. AS1 TaxID=2907626 RepID=UPI001F3F8B52|nr:DUF3488 and transglutaminase-like domain-containing protein [Shewanella sp. AS1]MCE9678825.1 DUF3488 and transglutaminase-like domain-containing protein [Shewanella sp. AS1]